MHVEAKHELAHARVGLAGDDDTPTHSRLYYPSQVRAVHDDGTADLQFEHAGVGINRNVEPNYIRKVRGSSYRRIARNLAEVHCSGQTCLACIQSGQHDTCRQLLLCVQRCSAPMRCLPRSGLPDDNLRDSAVYELFAEWFHEWQVCRFLPLWLQRAIRKERK